MLHDLLYQESSFGVFLLVTVILGGGAAWLAGRAVAIAWSRWWLVVVYGLLIGFAVRFIHFALFGATLPSPHYFAVDTLFACVFGLCRFSRHPRTPDGTPIRVFAQRHRAAGVNIARKISDICADWRLNPPDRTSAADLKFLQRLPQARKGTSKRKATLES